MSKFSRQQLEGKQFGRWTVLSFVKNNKPQSYWLCRCSCINQTEREIGQVSLLQGTSKSCGCLRKEHARNINFINLVDQKFGRLTVEKENLIRKNDGHVLWDCRCLCGNKKIVSSNDLKTGNIQSCGCLKEELLNKQRIDLTGRIFGELYVLGQGSTTSYRAYKWLCQCSCNENSLIEVSSRDLRSGKYRSCGCVKSHGELKIKQLLIDTNTKYVSQQTFQNLKSDKNKVLQYDFGIYNDDTLIALIEFDGKQHFDFTGYSWNTEENFLRTRKHDILKTQYAINNNIPLIRIPYWHYINLQFNDLTTDGRFIISKINDLNVYFKIGKAKGVIK